MIQDEFDLDQWQLGGLTSFSQTCFAKYWSKLPDPTSDDLVSSIDPYSFTHRMALGKYLIEHTGGESIWGKDCTKHWFWGYLAQMDWQRRSGRFADPSTWNASGDVKEILASSSSFGEEDAISRRSWWGYMNLNFSVAVYCGAAEAGIVPKVSFLSSSSSDDDQTNIQDDEGFRQCVEHWKMFWSTHHKQFVNGMGKTTTTTTTKADDSKALVTTLYQHLWQTHTGIIVSGISHGKEMEALLPEEDRNIGLGFCNTVELLASMSFILLSLDYLCKFGVGYLPTIRLAGPESVEHLKRHRPQEHVAITNLWKLKDASPKTMEFLCGFWSRVTYWDFQRENMPRTFNVLGHGSRWQKVVANCRVLCLAIAPRSLVGFGIWGGVVSSMVLVKFL